MTAAATKRLLRAVACAPVAALLIARAFADEAAGTQAVSPEDWSVHGQFTYVWQYHPGFTSPYEGALSLDPHADSRETVTATLYAGVRLWRDIALYVNPEIDQGFGLSNTSGIADFSSGEAYKIGSSTPYYRMQRLYLRDTINLGGDMQAIGPGANQLAGTRSAERIELWLGKFAVTDLFDANDYAHDPSHDFLNWAIIDSGAYDYTADSWGYSSGAAAEWIGGPWWTLRAGIFNLSNVPNSETLGRNFDEFEAVLEGEARFSLAEHAGKLKLLGFVNRGRMGSYADAVAYGAATGTTPNVALVRHYASRPGVALNFQQEISATAGVFARLSTNDGSKETYEFTEIDRSLALGASLKGNAWGRAQDTVGIAMVDSALSAQARAYFAAGGLGVVIGDGQLRHYANEWLPEIYYSLSVAPWLIVTADYQYVDNPAYNRDRGPVSVASLRVHTEL